MMNLQMDWQLAAVEIIRAWGLAMVYLVVGAATIWIIDGLGQMKKYRRAA